MQDLVTSSRKLLYQNAGPGARLARAALETTGLLFKGSKSTKK